MFKVIFTKILLLVVLFLSFSTLSAKEKNEPQLQYSIKSNGNGQQGYWVAEVTAYVDKKSDIGNTVLQKCAVHGALFKGTAPGKAGLPQNPICTSVSAESQYSDFFKAFFQQDYKNYANVVTGTLSTIKVKKGYEVTATVQIAKDNLRKAMEQAGIVRKLGF